jgi:5'-3' exonuclease
MKERLALIDLDTLVYIIAYRQFTNGNRDNKELVKTHIKEFISTILVNTRADYVALAYQGKGHTNFRKSIYPDYKSTRPESPEFIVCWKEYILSVYEELGAVKLNIIETDDWNSIGYYKFKDKYEVITVSSDKDLEQVPGEHYNPNRNESHYVTPLQAYYCLCIQQLMGDRTDSIEGIDGVGVSKASKILNSKSIVGEEQLKIFNAYKIAYDLEGYYQYLKTKFLVTLLKSDKFSGFEKGNWFNITIKRNLFNIQNCSDLITTNIFN